MAPLDWKRFMKLNVEDLEEDDAKAEDIFDILAEFDASGEDDPERLKQLFKISQSLMLIKSTQLQVAEEELQDAAADVGKSKAQKDQAMEDLRQEIANLERENRELKRGFGPGESSRDTRYLREELNELENQISVLQKDLKDRDRQLHDEKMQLDRYIQRAEDAERELRDLRKDNDQMREDLRDYQRQLDAQRESMVARRDDDSEYRDKISQKNKLLNAALEENRNLVEMNVELENRIDTMKTELREGKMEIEKTTDDYLKLKNVVDKGDSALSRLQRENEMLKDQIDGLTAQVRSRSDQDDNIMVQVNAKVEEWRTALADKDARVLELQQTVAELKQRINSYDMDSEKTSVVALTKALEERDQKIETLKRRLEEAVGDFESNALLMDDVRNELGKSSRGDRQQSKVATLQGTLRHQEVMMRDAEARAAQAEEDAREKDKELNEALNMVRQLESGVYGLPEAVADIKNLKTQINVRDRQIEELTQHVNQCELKMNELYDESEDLRERLGLDPREPLDMGEFKKRKGVRMQEDRALNRVLQKELERLEEERIELKQTIRRLAQASGARAVALGLTADDIVAVDGFIDQLKEKNSVSEVTRGIKADAERDELRARHQQAEKEVEKTEQKLKRISEENSQLKAKSTEVENENKQLEKGMKEILDALKEHSGKDGETIQCPTLERMLAAIDSKNMLGRYDTTLYLKAQVDNLTGHNEELRKELREARYEATRAKIELEKGNSKVESLEAEVKTLKQVGAAGGFYQTLPLPEGIAATSADVIASLNEHLVQALQEVELKEEMISKMEAGLESYRRKFAVMRHQQGLLYQDYIKDKNDQESSLHQLEEQLREVTGLREEDKVRLQEFDRMLDSLGQEEPEVRRRLADMTRKITVLRVNEKALARRYNSLSEVEAQLRKDNNKHKNDMIAMETAVAERLGYLQRYKDMAQFQIASLQKTLDDSVPAYEMESLNRQFTELTEKYRDLLEKSNTLVARTEESSGYEIETKRLHNENNTLKKELEIEKEKLHTLEAAFENMRKEGKASTQNLRDSDVISISKKLTTLEMKELNERQRAEHASHMYEQQKLTLRTLEDRNFELEQKFSELTRMSLDQQKVERELRDELANSVTKEVSDNDRKRITKLEESENALKLENSKLKEISEVAAMQVSAYEQQQTSRDKEVLSLRQQLVDFQAQSDEKTVIGKLHRHIVQLQVSEGVALRKLEQLTNKVTKLDALQLRTEQRMDDKDQTIYHNRLEARSKAKYLKHTIQDLRKKFAGAVPLPQQEKFAKQMLRLQEDKAKIEQELKETNEERMKVEDRLIELKVQHDGLEELIVTLKDGKGAEKVVEWHKKMETVRLDDLKLKRDIEKIKYQMKFQEGLLRRHEMEVLSLEEDKVRQAREFESRELEWERREVELERIIANMERAQKALAGAASEFDAAVGALPDSSLPVAQQLDLAVQTIRKNVKLILDAKAEVAHYKQRHEELESALKAAQLETVQRDRLIAELRLRMPADAARDQLILNAQTAAASHGGGGTTDHMAEDYEAQQAVRVAQSTVASLQARIAQKEETLQKYQELLNGARQDMMEQNKRHEEELRVMQDKLHNKNDQAFNTFKQHIHDTLSHQAEPAPTNDQLRKLNELEDIVADQDNSIAALRDKLSSARNEVNEWKCRHDDAVRSHADQKESLLSEHAEELAAVKGQLTDLQHQLSEKDQLLEHTQDELDRQKEANTRAPTSTMKNMVDRLKNEIALKEKQHKALSKALLELRADMVTQAQEDVKAHADANQNNANVQRLVDSRTKELQDRNEELDGTVTKQKKVMAKLRQERKSAVAELEEARQDFSKKEAQLKRLKEDKARLEEEVEELERKVERMGTMGKQKGESEAVHQEVTELRRKNKLLQDEVRRAKHQHQAAEKPYEQAPTTQTAGAATSTTPAETMVARWEENKKWQKMVDRLKSRTKEKDEQIEKLTKANELLRNGLDRANKDKERLEARLSTALKGGLERPVVAAQLQANNNAIPPGGTHTHEVQALKKHNHDLQEELSRLRRELSSDRDIALEEVQLRNRMLQEKLDSMENQLARRQLSASQEGSATTAAFRQMADKEQTLQKQVLKLSEENLELRFEVEQTKKDIPRLKERIADQQKYIEILKTEKEQLKELSSARSHSSLGSLGSLTSLSSNIRRIGESGKSQKDLEKTIALLKKVVERTQAENHELKKAPGIVQQTQLTNLLAENSGLKSQLEELRQKMGSTLSERYVSQQKGTAKVIADHDKLRRDLIKEQEANEKLRVSVKQHEATVKRLQQQLAEQQQQAAEDEQRRQSLGAMDSGAWKATVTGKMAEERMRSMQDELDKKTSLLSDVRLLLREAAEREQQLLRDKAALAEQVATLQCFPAGAEALSDAELVNNYQQQRLTLERVENEKKELLHEIDVLRREVNATAGRPGDVSTDDVVEKITSYNKMMGETVDLRTQLKATELSRNQLTAQVDKLKKELQNFGPDFFEEIEDLKYNYREAVQKNVLYEEQLGKISKQFGIAVDIPFTSTS